ncbi:UDP-N-acetylglucosamine 1-carboxyvinyltransferase [Pullulanibacillus sp. KACC 23026]|uniref:UDP-N-acetylglucosamine 1-carboxyvinyltransferase n=1 Tax=Pullulanibacillus sp. KACC 23026 TaxID=3028315 RepID=UPI0023B02791|nr:UDP-N-acetylglucosamine 1-carboxyvinyltransferase [Pullulanibacillus sp. KACC 23026]WEG13118.1 UDP-N-acetylglucosamine 1-carboxyvinyltransferase [Pullulanibacillus sp. KACC 23026]
MEKIFVRGGKRLSGTVRIDGAKNAVLPVIAATILASRGTSRIENVPALADVYTINEVLRHLGAEVEFEGSSITINAQGSLESEAPFEYVRKMRASFFIMGPLLARVGHAKIALPGGCAIGQRPIDQHLKGFEAMGATVQMGNGYIEAKVPQGLQGANIYLDFPSVGATENIMMAAVLAKGETIINNAAQEPEIECLANYLIAMGGKIKGAGTSTIRIQGVRLLKGVSFEVIPDRIEAGTYMIAAAITGGNVLVENAIADHLRPLIAKLEEMGVEIQQELTGIRVIGPDILKPVDIKTLPHPGFPTDLQSQMMALLLKAKGTSIITETVFENRFMHVEEFRRMSADIKIESRSAIINGPCRLQGAEVAATDLRAGAALVLAGLAADGTTRVTDLHHIDRGYVDLTGKLQSLGASIERLSVKETPAVTEEVTPKLNMKPKFA